MMAGAMKDWKTLPHQEHSIEDPKPFNKSIFIGSSPSQAASPNEEKKAFQRFLTATLDGTPSLITRS